jgi:sugar phosphate isomerase/epimerase
MTPNGAAATEDVGFARRLGIFARTFRRGTTGDVAAAVAQAGYAMAHWNFAAIGRETLASDVEPALFDEVRRAFEAAGLTIPSVSATFNLIHPDTGRVSVDLAKAQRLTDMAPRLGATVVTICTGTRDPGNMWRAHPDNDRPDAWHAMRSALDRLLESAAGAGVEIGIEPEPGNVVKDADAAARLLGELGSSAPVGIVLDPANLLDPATVSRQTEIIGHALDVVGHQVIGIQAKDVVAGGYSAAGVGLLDYPTLLRQLAELPEVPIIVQDADEHDAARVRLDLVRWQLDNRRPHVA